jgi:two-component system sensor kinase FixL
MSAHSGFCAADESHSILTAILERSDDAIIRANLEGEIVGWSRGASRLYGYSAEEMCGSPLGVLIPDDGWMEFARMLEQLRRGVSINHCETVRRGKGDRLIPVLLSMLPVTDEANHVVSTLSIARDLTALKRAEFDYRTSEASWRAIFESAVDGIVVIDARGTIRSFNGAAERLFGYGAEEVVGKNVNILMPAPYRDEHDQYIARYLGGAPAKIIGIGREVMGRRRSGEDFPARLAVGEASVDGEMRFTGIVHDLTERVQIEKRLREQTALAQLGEMAAVVAHEVRNALSGVQGAVHIIGSRFPEGSREAAVAEEVVARLDTLAKMVKDMLLFVHLPEPSLQPVNIEQLVGSIAGVVRADPIFRDVAIEVTGSAPPIVGDPDLLQTVLVNLLTNSAQAMDGEGTIRLVIDATPRSCEIAILDEGPGVSPDIRERLFHPFFTTKARGTGLGLATAKRIVEAHSGTLRMEFPDEGGTRAVVQLPA